MAVRSLFLRMLFASGALSVGAAALACPHCPSNLGPTLAEQVAAADVALFASWRETKPADPDHGFPGETTFRVTHVLHDKTGRFPVDGEFVLKGERPGGGNDSCLLLGVDGPAIEWMDPLAMTAASMEYIREAPLPTVPARERLAFFLERVEHADVVISNDAFGEIAAATYEDVAAIAQKVSAETVRGWLADPQTDQIRLGFYGMLLGLVGGDEDARALERIIVRSTQDFRLGIDGMISGYLMLTGETGLDVIERTKLRDPECAFSETYAALMALRFVWTYAPERLPRERLRAALRLLLDRPELTDLIVTDLARWEDWSVTDRLMELYAQPETGIPPVKRAIVRFFLVAERAHDSPETAKRAHAYLVRLRAREPGVIKDAERFFFVNPPDEKPSRDAG